MRGAGYLVSAVALVAVVLSGRAHACSSIGPVPHVLDDALVGVDRTPPTLPKPIVAQISRHDGTGCMSGDSCGDFTAANITNLATDDMTAANRIGYRFAVVAGTPPDGLSLPTGVVDLALPDASLWLSWPGEGDDVDFTLELVAVDAAGNESAPQTVRIYDDTFACNIGRRNGINGRALAIVIVTLAAAARRRRSS
jgi:hypothetical protein